MNYIVSIPVNENLASFIGKKGSENGLVFYNRKLDENLIVAIMPANKERQGRRCSRRSDSRKLCHSIS